MQIKFQQIQRILNMWSDTSWTTFENSQTEFKTDMIYCII